MIAFSETTSRYHRWKDFHNNNPQVYDLFVRFARQARDRERRQRFGARMIWERLRWYTQIETNDATAFKLNDHYPPYYARLLMLEHPDDFAEFFELRDSRFDVTLDQMRADFFGTDFIQREIF